MLVTFLRLKLPLGLALLPGMQREIGGGGEKAVFRLLGEGRSPPMKPDRPASAQSVK